METTLHLPHATAVPAFDATISAIARRTVTLVGHCLWVLLQIGVFGAIVLWPWETAE
jgi:hypothetical protein